MNVPKLRFKEFTDEWIKIDLSTCFEYFSTNSLSREQLSDHGIIKNIHYGDIHKKYGNVVDVENDVATYIKDTEQINKYEFCCENDIIFADASEDYDGIGKAIELINVNEKLVSGLHTIHARDKKQFFSPLFKGYYFNTPIIHNQIRILANGFKVFGISKDNINNLKVMLPSKQEQDKIAKLLSLLDKKIELQAKKIEDLKLFKSSQICTILNKLEHKNVFLKNLGYFISGNPIGKDKITDKGIPVILYGDLYTKYEEEINDVNQYVKENKKYIKSEKGDLIFPTSTTVDAISLISPSVINISDVVYGGDLIVFKVNKAIVNPKFLSYQINHLKKKEFSKKAQGSTIIHIHADDLLNSTVEIPIMKYQKIISNFGSAINKKIELEKNKLDKLKLLKIGLLQNMFI